MLTALICLAMTGISVSAQSLSVPANPTQQVTAETPLNDLNEEQIYRLMSRLDEKQVRDLLLRRLVDDAKQRAAAAAVTDNRSLAQISQDYAASLGRFLSDVVSKVPNIPAAVASTFERVGEQRGDRNLFSFWGVLAASLAFGGAAALLFRSALSALATRTSAAIERRLHNAFWARAINAVGRLLIWMVLLASFAGGAHATNAWLNAGHDADQITTTWIIAITGWTIFAAVIARFLFAPRRPDLRLCETDDATASLLTWRIVTAALIFNAGFGFATWLNRFGSPFDETWIGFWVNTALHVFLFVSIWQARRGISQIVSSGRNPDARPSMMAALWPYIMMVLIALHWLIIELIVASGSVPGGLFPVMATTLATVLALPILDHAVRASVENAIPAGAETEPRIQAANLATQRGLVRVGRVVLLACVALGLLWLWGINLVALAEQGVGAQFAGSTLNILLILVMAYAVWELVRIITDRQIAIEQVALGIKSDPAGEMEGEGGGAGARLGTLLPLIRVAAQITIAVMTLLAVLGELGVNILPLLAGAGVVGLAIGFGAQTLVRDIISGVFFLIDDAFRKGEYIDIGSVKGTVEKISLRSMQLRHHNGPLNTIPFGDIRHVTNFSRDWVVMKLSLRLTYDTDAEKVRKMIKKLGQELLKEPELGPQFLQPLKSQGVIEMDDSAMIMRVKFMTRPGDQWMLRRVVYARIRDLFEANNIRFANREVTVRLEGGTDRHLTDADKEAIGAAAFDALPQKSVGPPDKR